MHEPEVEDASTLRLAWPPLESKSEICRALPLDHWRAFRWRFRAKMESDQNPFDLSFDCFEIPATETSLAHCGT